MKDKSEIASNVRNHLLYVVELWANTDMQVELQERIPFINVPTELFELWYDLYYPDEKEVMELSIDKDELELINLFGQSINGACANSPKHLPELNKFMKTQEYQKTQQAAIQTLKELKKHRR